MNPYYSRRHQHYHSQRSTRTVDLSNHQPRPASTYYEYETLHYNGGGNGSIVGNAHHSHLNSSFHNGSSGGSQRSSSRKQSPMKWSSPTGIAGGSGRSRGPFITQVTIRESQQHQPNQSNLSHHISSHMSPQPASKV